VAGLKLAQVLSTKKFSDQELLEVATKIEGHPDNVAPALFGGLTLSLMVNAHPKTIKASFPEIGLLAYIPDFELETKVSRSVPNNWNMRRQYEREVWAMPWSQPY
jgi:homoserine kinase